MGKILDVFMPKLWPWLALAVAAVLLMQTLRIKDLQLEIAGLHSAASKVTAEQAVLGQVAAEKKAATLLDHAEGTQTNVYEYTQKITKLEAARVRDAADIARLQQQLSTTATARAQAASDAAVARDLADHYQRLAAHLAEGASVVDGLMGLVERRDAQVTALWQQVHIERATVERLLGE